MMMDEKRNLIGHPSDYGSRTLENETEQNTDEERGKKTDESLQGDPIAAQEITENGNNV